MFFFINQTIPNRLTGIESAQYKRLAMLKRHKIPAKIVTLRYNTIAAQNIQTYQLDPRNVINLYDYFCGIPSMAPSPLKINDLSLPDLPSKELREGEQMFYLNDQPLFKVFTDSSGNVTKINYYGKDKKAVRSVVYDIRGFKSSETIFNQQIIPARQSYFGLDGQIKLTMIYRKNKRTQANEPTDIFYYGEDDRIYHFKELTELQSFFLDSLNKEYLGENIFVADRTLPSGWGLTHMRTRAFKLFHIHSSHVNRLEEPFSDNFNTHYRYAFKNLSQWNGMIASTKSQVAHLREKFPETLVFPASVSIISRELLQRKPLPYKKRTRNKVIVAARIEAGKRIDEIIQIIALVKKEIPEISLDLWGLTADKKVEEKLRALVEELDLTDTVTFNGYTTNMTAVYDRAMLLMITSQYEGTALVIAESLVHGVPVVAYDFSYGPREFIRDGKNGYIVPVNDRELAAKRVVRLLRDKSLWTKMSRNAHQGSTRSSEEKIVEEWKKIQRAATTFYQGGET